MVVSSDVLQEKSEVYRSDIGLMSDSAIMQAVWKSIEIPLNTKS
jgi:hypothetical protein